MGKPFPDQWVLAVRTLFLGHDSCVEAPHRNFRPFAACIRVIDLDADGAPLAGTGVFIPHVIVRNLTGSPQSVSITLENPGEKEPQQAPLAPLALGPYATVDVALDSAFAMLPMPLPYCSIRIQYSGLPGTVIGGWRKPFMSAEYTESCWIHGHRPLPERLV